MRRSDHGEPVLRLVVANRVPSREQRTRGADRLVSSLEDRAQHARGQLFGKGGHREREERRAPHGEDVVECIRRRDGAEVARVVHHGREEVDGEDERALVVELVDRGVVGRAEPDEQVLGLRRDEAREQLVEPARGVLGRAAAGRDELRELHLARGHALTVRVRENAAVARSALVTGGSRGIGLAIARMLAEEGFAITLASRSSERVEDAAASLDAFAITADVSHEEDCDRLVAQHVERHGGLDVLVNSAGIGIGGNIEALPVKHIDLQLGVNLRGLVLVTRAAIPHLRESRGLIVNLASIAGTMPTPWLSIYGATKAAVISFTHSLNGELEADGVRASALCPGFVDTDMAQWSGIPGEEMIQPEDCAEVVRLLLRLGPTARIPVLVIELPGSTSA